MIHLRSGLPPAFGLAGIVSVLVVHGDRNRSRPLACLQQPIRASPNDIGVLPNGLR